ncbi:DUF4153 domain-containing protein [Anaerofustis stercorihominis]|uniref:DUF4153 domain-containing protein n=1 Tax=Anaerofustis stercorihominis TaxID=214853 RepID=UPI00210E1AC2|nr:DUF4153 domain-containing protein [Anaerofustis stercorihominis]MCQ4794338.1 DUF4153 domain-containing protein [Anaerofustis stercorihominis]
MKENLQIKVLNKKLKESINRFIPTFIFTIIMFLCTFVTNIGLFKYDISEFTMSLITGIIVSILVNIFFEYKKQDSNKTKNNILSIVISSFVTIVFCILLLYTKGGYKDLVHLAYYGIIIASLLIMIYTIYTSENEKALFIHLFASFMLTGIISIMIYLGLSICYSAFELLIFNFKYLNMFMIIASFSFSIIFINFFLTFIPKREAEIKTSKIYTNIIKKVMLPLYTILIGVLYLYIFKIIFTGTIPVGEMNPYASLALLGYIFLYLSINNINNKFILYFKKYGSFVLIPIIITQLIFIGIRINAYGLTPLRLLSLILIFIGIIFLICIITKKSMKYPFLIGGIILLIFTVSPFNLYSISNKTQELRLIKVLEKNDMYKEGVIIKSNELSEEDKNTIESCHNYLISSSGVKSRLVKFISDKKDTTYLYGFEFKENNDEYSNIVDNDKITYSFDYDIDDKGLNIDEYSKMFRIKSDALVYRGKYIKNKNGENVSFDFTDYFNELYENNKENNNKTIKMIYEKDNVKVVFTYLDLKVKDKNIINCSYEGILFIK